MVHRETELHMDSLHEIAQLSGCAIKKPPSEASPSKITGLYEGLSALHDGASAGDLLEFLQLLTHVTGFHKCHIHGAQMVHLGQN